MKRNLNGPFKVDNSRRKELRKMSTVTKVNSSRPHDSKSGDYLTLSEPESYDEDSNGQQLILRCPHKRCKKFFTRRVRLQSHLHLHNGTQPFKCPEPTCGKAFSEKQNLRIHMLIHSDERPFVCPQGCG
jgi:uncharacterized Zn-finger protein